MTGLSLRNRIATKVGDILSLLWLQVQTLGATQISACALWSSLGSRFAASASQLGAQVSTAAAWKFFATASNFGANQGCSPLCRAAGAVPVPSALRTWVACSQRSRCLGPCPWASTCPAGLARDEGLPSHPQRHSRAASLYAQIQGSRTVWTPSQRHRWPVDGL